MVVGAFAMSRNRLCPFSLPVRWFCSVWSCPSGTADPVIQEYEAIDTFLLWVFALEVCLRIGSFHPPRVDFYDEKYGRRLWLHVSGRLRYCFTPWVIIDLVTILAFLPELRSLRALRLLRLLRGFQLFRYSNPFVRLARALAENRLQFYMAAS